MRLTFGGHFTARCHRVPVASTFMENKSCGKFDTASVQAVRRDFVNRAGSSMRLVRLKPQGPGPDRGPDRPVQRKFTK